MDLRLIYRRNEAGELLGIDNPECVQSPRRPRPSRDFTYDIEMVEFLKGDTSAKVAKELAGFGNKAVAPQIGLMSAYRKR